LWAPSEAKEAAVAVREQVVREVREVRRAAVGVLAMGAVVVVKLAMVVRVAVVEVRLAVVEVRLAVVEVRLAPWTAHPQRCQMRATSR